MNKIRILWVSVILITLIGCQGKVQSINQLETISLDAREAMVNIASASGFVTVFEVDENYFVDHLNYESQEGIEINGLFGSVLDANRIVYFKLTTQENKDYALNYLETMKTQMVDAMQENMGMQKELIQNGIVLSDKNYIVFISGEKAQLGSEIFQELIQ